MRNHLLFISAALVTAGFVGCGGGSGTGTSSGSGSPANPVPSISSISPISVAVGSSATTLYVYGSNYNAGTVVLWNGIPLNSTYVNSGTVTAAVPQSNLSTAANVQITVSNTGPSAVPSAPVSFLVANPRPILTTMSPQFVNVGEPLTITAAGSYIIPGTQILWNGNALNTTQVNSTTLSAQVPSNNLTAAATVSVALYNPGPGGGPSATVLPLTIYSGSTRVAGIPLYANDIVWDGTHGVIYASVPGASASDVGNVVAINPATGAVTAKVAAGINPDKLSVSSNGSQLWVGEDGIGSVERFALPALTSDVQVNLPRPDAYHTQPALSLQAAPGDQDTVAALVQTATTVFDLATPRPAAINNNDYAVSLAWGADSSTLLGSGGLNGFGSLDVMAVDSSGLQLARNFSYPISGFANWGIQFDPSTGFIYTNTGKVLNPATGDMVGVFDLSAFYVGVYCAVDSAQGLVFFIGETMTQSSGDFGYTLEVFDKSSYQLLHSLVIPNLASGQAPPARLIRWGNSGLAFLSTSKTNPMLYLVDGKFVNSTATPDLTIGRGVDPLPNPTSINPESTVAGSSDVTVTITGTDFIPGAQTYWSPVWGPPNTSCPAVQTAYINPMQLKATIPACYLAVAGAGTITVSNGTTSSLRATPFQFTIFPAGPNPLVMNMAASSMAWDAKSQLLYAAVGSADPQYPNSIVAINPANGNVVKSQQVGPNPSLVRVTSDGAYLYVGYQNASSITRLRLPGLDAPLAWSLGSDAVWGPITASDLDSAPAAPQTVAVAGSNGAAMVFDDGIIRSGVVASPTSGNIQSSLQWGSDASVLYGAGTGVDTHPWDLTIMNVDTSGVSLKESDPGALKSLSTPGTYGNTMHYDRGTRLLYVEDGAVVDPTNATFKGGYNSWGLVVPDSSLNTVFILGMTYDSTDPFKTWANGFGLLSYNQKTFGFINSVKLPPIPYSGVAGQPVAFVRCGGSCVAFATNSLPFKNYGRAGMLYILNNPAFVTAAP